jgi:hypothetical protein
MYPEHLLLGSITHGITLVDPSALTTLPIDYCRRIEDPITLESTTFASLENGRSQDQCYATMWSDYRTAKCQPYSLDLVVDIYRAYPQAFHSLGNFIENKAEGINGIECDEKEYLPCQRCLDAVAMEIVRDKSHRTMGWVLSISDGYDYPPSDRMQIKIAKAAALVCEEMIKTVRGTIELPATSLSKDELTSRMAKVGDDVLQTVQANEGREYVGVGNTTVCVHVRPASIPEDAVVALEPTRPALLIDTISVGDCLAFLYHPSSQSIDILACPKKHLANVHSVTRTKDYQPFSVTRLSQKQDHEQLQMVEHSHHASDHFGSMLFLMTNGCWDGAF